MTVAERFWAKVDRSGGPDACWPFTGAINKYGYGHFSIDGKTHRANRVALALGDPPDVQRPGGPIPPREIPEGMYSLHNCDLRKCCNLAHLRLGDQSENNDDAYARFRRPAGRLAFGIREAAAARAAKRRMV